MWFKEESREEVVFHIGLKIEDLEFLGSIVNFRTLAAGEVIYQQGDAAEAFYAIEKGHIEVISESLGAPEVIANFSRRGDYFGEVALITDGPRSATVKTVTESKLLVLTRKDFLNLETDNPGIFNEVAEILSRGTRYNDSHFAETILRKNEQLAHALDELEEAQEELLRRERLSLVGKLASGIIHDLKKPMTCISGYAQLLGGKSVTDERRKRYGYKITQEVHRLVDMINEILQFARGEQKIVCTRVNIDDWLSEILGILHREFEDGRINFQKKIELDERLHIDSEKFKSVFFNIAANAITAMPEGGTFQFACSRQSQNARLEFIDTGVGMSAETASHVFEDFFSQAKDGTGLGMAIVKRIVEAHQGTIEVESELGKGTKYTVLLPLED